MSLLPFDCCVLFRPKASKTAALYLVRAIDKKGLEIECPVGKEIKTPLEYDQSGGG